MTLDERLWRAETGLALSVSNCSMPLQNPIHGLEAAAVLPTDTEEDKSKRCQGPYLRSRPQQVVAPSCLRSAAGAPLHAAFRVGWV